MLDQPSHAHDVQRIGHDAAPAPRRPPIRLALFGYYQGRRDRRIDLTDEEFGCLRVRRLHRVVRGRAIWTAECAKDLGGCGGIVHQRGEYLWRKGHCGCQEPKSAKLFSYGGKTLSARGWARELARQGISLSVRQLRDRLITWPIEKALQTPRRGTNRKETP